MGVVNWPSPCPQLNRPPAPDRLTTVNPAVAVGQLLAAPVPLLAQSNGGLAVDPSRTFLSPPVDPASMKFEGGVAETFINPTTSAHNARTRTTPNRVGWRAISAMLFDNSVTSC